MKINVIQETDSVSTVLKTMNESIAPIPENNKDASPTINSIQEKPGFEQQSLFEATVKGSPVRGNDEFMTSIMESHYGETRERASLLQPHLDKKDAYLHQSEWQKRTPATDVLALETKCLNSSKDMAHTSKLFKIACLAYSPSKVNYRNQ